MSHSRDLLTEYAEHGAESAFREVVTRYTNLVYSTARRQVGGDTHLAEDVAQIVFLHLAKKAKRIPGEVMIGGWLHQATCNVAATVMRAERRRQRRERHATEMNALQNDSQGTLDQIGPMLDEVIRQLPDEDRSAVLLRFFESRDFRSVGESIGISEDAARMRVNRALEKLQILLRKRGVTASAAMLGAALATDAVVAAPVGLASTLATNALVGASTTGPVALLKFMAISKIKLSAAGAIAIAALTTALFIQHQSLARLRVDARSLRQQLEIASATKEQPENPVLDTNEMGSPRQNESELLRRRAEVTALRRAQQALTPPSASVSPTKTG